MPTSQTNFEVIPAIDLLGGNVVRLYQGDYDQKTEYGSDPAGQARLFCDAGARLIHVVDLDGARTGERETNAAAIATILEAARAAGGEIEVGGGIRDLKVLAGYFERGVTRCILGTAAVKDRDFLQKALDEFGPERVIIGVDARDGRVRVAGWEEDTGLGVGDFVQELESRGAGEIIFTDIQTDGALSGPALDSLGMVLAECGLDVIASGGVSSIDDVRSLRDLGHPRLKGVITGRALYEGHLDLAGAVRAARGE